MGVFQLQRAGKLVGRTHPEQAKTLGGRNLAQRLSVRALRLGAARGTQRVVLKRRLPTCQAVLKHEPRRKGTLHANAEGALVQAERLGELGVGRTHNVGGAARTLGEIGEHGSQADFGTCPGNQRARRTLLALGLVRLCAHGCSMLPCRLPCVSSAPHTQRRESSRPSMAHVPASTNTRAGPGVQNSRQTQAAACASRMACVYTRCRAFTERRPAVALPHRHFVKIVTLPPPPPQRPQYNHSVMG